MNDFVLYSEIQVPLDGFVSCRRRDGKDRVKDGQINVGWRERVGGINETQDN